MNSGYYVVSVAHFNLSLAIYSSLCVTPLRVSQASARLLASNSTGSVISENREEAPNKIAPIHMMGWDPTNMPPKNTKGATVDPAYTKGTIALRASNGR